MAVQSQINRSEAAYRLALDALNTTLTRTRKPEGPFELFLMDFDISGTQNSLYPVVPKPYGPGSRTTAPLSLTDYLPARYAIGRARAYIVKALKLPKVTAAALKDLVPLTPGKYEKLKVGTTATAHDPEKSVIIIDTGKPIRIGLAGVLEQTGVEGQSINVPIKGPIQLRVPTAVTVRQFHAWLGSAKGPTDKTLLSYIALAGGRRVPIEGGGESLENLVLIDG